MAVKRTNSAAARSSARLGAVQALYQMELAGTEVNAIIAEFTSFRLQSQIEDDSGEVIPATLADPTYFSELVRGTVKHQREIDPLIDQGLASGWRLVRVDSTLRAILRVGVYELLERIEVPARVIINEYINVAHAFFSGDEPRVTNGVLDQLGRRLRPSEFESRRPIAPTVPE